MNRKSILRVFLLVLFCPNTCYFKANAQTTPDPGLMGPHTVIKAEYNLGDTVYLPPPAAGFVFTPTAAVLSDKMEIIGSVHYPADLTSGPYPLVIFLHGRHSTCYDSVSHATSLAWPCTGRKKPILSYEGYDYVAKTLASHGYIVVSISSNAINAIDNSLSDDGMNARGVLVQHHLDLWNTWNTVGGGPFGSTFVGKLNMQDVGTMGHSRGGEGVIFNAEYNKSLGSPYGIKGILTLAPVDFFRHIMNRVPLLDVVPYCDGDVNDNEGVHFYDDVRYNDTADEAPKHTVLFMGANHNYFNTVWTPGSYVAGGSDDWFGAGDATDPQCGPPSPKRFDTTKQKAALNAYLPAFFRLYLGNETQFAPILEVNDIVPPASSMLDTSNVFVSYHPARADRLDVNRIDSLNKLTTNSLVGAVTRSGLVSPSICGGYAPESDCFPSLDGAQEPHYRGLSQMEMMWADTAAWYQNDLPPAYEDLTPYLNLLFRASVNFTASPTSENQDFTVQLIDSAGNESSQVVTDHSHALFYQPGSTTNDLPKMLFNTINVPLSSFTGINLAQVRHIRFKCNQLPAGAVLISDLAFTNPLCGNFTALYTDSVTRIGNKVFYTNKSTSYDQDSLSWKWKFGDPASGLNDTSTQKNPLHIYSGPGTYNPCLYVTAHRKNGLSCVDSFCSSVVIVSHVYVPQVIENNITIIPNPAKDYLQINGAEKTDVLTLTDLYGQVVLTATLTQSRISLPQNLATGIYYATVTTATGRIYKKLLITK